MARPSVPAKHGGLDGGLAIRQSIAPGFRPSSQRDLWPLVKNSCIAARRVFSDFSIEPLLTVVVSTPFLHGWGAKDNSLWANCSAVLRSSGAPSTVVPPLLSSLSPAIRTAASFLISSLVISISLSRELKMLNSSREPNVRIATKTGQSCLMTNFYKSVNKALKM